MAASRCVEVLRTGKYAGEVVADEREAVARGLYAMPYFDFDGTFAVGGSMPLDIFREAVRKMMRMNGEHI